MAPRVFLSHATEDKQRFVKGLDERLRAECVDVWLDERELASSDSMVDGIFEQGLGKSDVALIVVSEHSIHSRWVREEMEAAVILRIEGRCRILPVVLDDVDVPIALKTAYHVRISDCDGYGNEFQRILSVIRGGAEDSAAGAPMGQAWLQHRVDYSIAKAGSRYTPRLHTKVAAERALEGVGRTSGFIEEWQECLATLRECRPGPIPIEAGVPRTQEQAQKGVEAALEDVDRETRAAIASLEGFADFPDLKSTVETARDSVQRLHALLQLEEAAGGEHGGHASMAWHFNAGRSFGAVEGLARLQESTSTQAALAQELLITGPAGTGKTHLLCEVASARIREGRPTILVLGQEFDREPLHDQIPRLTTFAGSVEDEVAALASAAQAAGAVGLLIVDALNESHQPGRWKDELGGLRHIVAQHEDVALVVSCRSELVSEVLGETDILRLEHRGFGAATETAITRYALEHGIDPVSFPVLSPEFSNPLFLSLACKALETLGHDSFQLGEAGLTTVCDAFLEAVNERLSSADRCDFNKQRDLVQEAVRILAEVALHSPLVDWDRAEDLLQPVLPDRTWSKSLLKGLLDEGVLIPTASGVGFGYQRVGDLAMASNLCDRSLEEIEDWIADLGDDRWPHLGVLGALAVKLPEQQGVELIELLADDEGFVGSEDIGLFAKSLALRPASAIGEETKLFLQQILDQKTTWEDPNVREAVCEQIVQLSCVPDHPLNAKWAHTWLMGLGLTERDAQWSQFFVGESECETPVRRLINWARDSSSGAGPDVRYLAGSMLGWMLTTSDNRVRDKATKALVALLEPDSDTTRRVLASFRGLNDPYALERLAGVACGVALRSNEPETHCQIADGVAGLLGAQWPAHLLTRDYANRVLELALQAGWESPDAAGHEWLPYSGPPYNAAFPSPNITIDEIKEMADPADSGYGTIWRSLTGHGDFEKHMLSSAIENFAADNGDELIGIALRAIFERVLELGWTPEVFAEIDRRLQLGSSTGHAVERIGKKYQWIAFYEVLGHLADHLLTVDRWSDDPPVPYRYAEQIVGRDIDLTVLAQPEPPGSGQAGFWYSPASAGLSPGEKDQGTSGILRMPDPLNLIAVKDHGERRWLSLHVESAWRESPLPERIARRHLGIRSRDMRIRSFVIPAAEICAIKDWAATEHWRYRWIPRAGLIVNALLGSHPHHPSCELASGNAEFHLFDIGGPPCNLFETTAYFIGTLGRRDYSAPNSILGLVPSKMIHQLLNLNRARDFVWANPEGTDIAQDSSLVIGGHNSMLASREEITSRLAEEGLALLWIASAFGIPYSGGPIPSDAVQWIDASATYILEGTEVVLQQATAQPREAGSIKVKKLPWPSPLKQRG